MARKRAPSNFLGILIGIVALVVSFLIINFTDISTSSEYGSLSVWLGGTVVAAFFLGFFAYKRDGIKITLFACILMIIGGVILGVLMLTLGEEIVQALGDNILTLIIGPTFLALFVVLGIALIVGSIVGSGVLIGVAAIGSAIGEQFGKIHKLKYKQELHKLINQ